MVGTWVFAVGAVVDFVCFEASDSAVGVAVAPECWCCIWIANGGAARWFVLGSVVVCLTLDCLGKTGDLEL